MFSDPSIIIWVTLTFLFAGTVKGVIGMGLPAWSIGLLTAAIGLHPAMAIMLVPTIVTNIWQALVGGHFRAVITRVWPFLLTAAAAVWLGAAALTRLDIAHLSAFLGILLMAYALYGLLHPTFALPQRTHTWAGVIAGGLNGIFGGMTGTFAVPGVPYLQAIGMPRDELIQAMGILFTLSTAMLALALGRQHVLTFDLGVISTLAVLPAIAGMAIGQYLRRLMPEAMFRKVLLSALVLLGGYIVVQSMLKG
jgi:hypothetical protein